MPFWSPDSRRLAFFAQGQLKTIDLGGGAAHAIAPAPIPRGDRGAPTIASSSSRAWPLDPT